jgi:hypothetical protein
LTLAAVDPRRELLEQFRQRRKLEKEALAAEKKAPFVVGRYPLEMADSKCL